MLPGDIRARDVYAYRNKREQVGKVTANHEVGVLKHVFTKAVEWGVLDLNPARDVRKFSIPRRRRYVTDSEFDCVHAVAPPMVRVAMRLAVLTGLRRGDILSLTRAHLTDEDIRVETSKTGKVLVIEWSDELREVVDGAKRLPPHVRQHLVANARGKPYTADGFATQWDRAMAKALKNGLTERFHFHDLRAKSASDDDLQAASDRLGHGNVSTTQRYYRRAPEKVRPLR
jgi:integrase